MGKEGIDIFNIKENFNVSQNSNWKISSEMFNIRNCTKIRNDVFYGHS